MSRHPSRRLVLAGIAVLVLGINAFWSITAEDGRGATKTAPRIAAVYGVSDPELITQSAAVQVSQLKAMKAMGITSVRLDASWYWGQPSGPNSYEWASLDQVVESIERVGGMTADLEIDGTPAWAAIPSASGNEFAQPASPAPYAKWAAAVAARYKNKGVKYFEIWNEPNIARFWAPTPNPAAYTALLRAANKAIKKADPAAVVLSGGLSPAATDGTNYNPRTFLTDMYADGAKNSFNGLGYHPYSFPTDPNTVRSWSAWSQMSQTSSSMRSIMDKNGDAAKKIYITEYGAPSSGPQGIGADAQRTELIHAIAQVKKDSWIGSFYIYTWSDLSRLAPVDNGFGLRTEADAPKPAYNAVANAIFHG